MDEVFGSEVMSEAVSKSLSYGREVFQVFVSSGVKCTNIPGTKYMIIMKSNPRFWWFKHQYFSLCADQTTKKMKRGATPPSWFYTNQDLRRRDKPHGPNQYGVRKSGSAHTVIAFTLTVYDGGLDLKAQVTNMFKIIHAWFVSPSPERAACKYVGLLRHTMPNFLKAVEKIDRTTSISDDHMRAAARKAEVCIKSVTKAPPNICYETPLDMFMLDEDIKRFVEGCGYSSWAGLDGDLSSRKVFYKNGNLVPWDRIESLP